MSNYLKRRLANMAQRIAILLWIPGVLLVSNCGGRVELKPPSGGHSVNNNSQTSTFDEIIVFCGNPGVGKSSLCNSIFQETKFESGLSVGEGMTKKKQEYIYENRKYIDTPGLADVRAREEAAREIESALKENNNYKIIFVALLDAARVRASDLVTINTVCDAIKAPFEYGIIFNKVSKQVSRKLGTVDSLNTYLADLHKQPASTLIISKDPDMDDEGNTFLSRNSEDREKLVKFIVDLKANRILDEQVQALDVRDYEEKFQEIETKLTEALKKAEEASKRAETESQERQKLAEQISIMNQNFDKLSSKLTRKEQASSLANKEERALSIKPDNLRADNTKQASNQIVTINVGSDLSAMSSGSVTGDAKNSKGGSTTANLAVQGQQENERLRQENEGLLKQLELQRQEGIRIQREADRKKQLELQAQRQQAIIAQQQQESERLRQENERLSQLKQQQRQQEISTQETQKIRVNLRVIPAGSLCIDQYRHFVNIYWVGTPIPGNSAYGEFFCSICEKFVRQVNPRASVPDYILAKVNKSITINDIM